MERRIGNVAKRKVEYQTVHTGFRLRWRKFWGKEVTYSMNVRLFIEPNYDYIRVGDYLTIEDITLNFTVISESDGEFELRNTKTHGFTIEEVMIYRREVNLTSGSKRFAVISNATPEGLEI